MEWGHSASLNSVTSKAKRTIMVASLHVAGGLYIIPGQCNILYIGFVMRCVIAGAMYCVSL